MPVLMVLVLATEILVSETIYTFLFKFELIFPGGGFFVKYHGLWTLHGVVSSGSSQTDGGCDSGRYSLFTNVLNYTTWIDDIINKNVTKILI